MNFILKIAWRYLFAKKTTNAINLITGISILGISIGTAALILILSVFNGFEGLIKKFLDSFNPDIKIEIIEGKHFHFSPEQQAQIKELEGIAYISKTIEEVAIFEYNDIQAVGLIKGVDTHFNSVTKIDSSIRSGKYFPQDTAHNFCVAGLGIASKLSMDINDPFSLLTIYAPHRKKKGLMSKDFKSENLLPIGFFSLQSEKDYKVILCSYEIADELLETNGQISAVEIKLQDYEDEKSIRKKLELLWGEDYSIKNRYMQDDTYLKVMNIEKWMSFLIVSLTILIVAFNLIGSLWMIVLEKKRDISILKTMGLHDRDIFKLFMTEGALITFIGISFGILIAVALYYAQVEFGLIAMSDGFIVSAYPIKLRITDFFLVTAVVLFIGILASLLPASKASSISAFVREG